VGKIRISILALVVILLGCTTVHAGKVRTGKAKGNTFIDSRYGFTFQKNDDWGFRIPKEKSNEPAECRFELYKQSVKLLKRRIVKRFRRGRVIHSEPLDVFTSLSIKGGFFVDTTSLDINGFKWLLIKENRKHKQKLALAELAGFIRHNDCVEQRLIRLGNLGFGYRLSFRSAYSVNSAFSGRNGEVYFTVNAGKVYLFFFTFRDPYYYNTCRREIERMLGTLTFPGKQQELPATVPIKVCMK